MPGAAGCTEMLTGGDAFPATRTTTVAGPGPASNGTCALICCGDTKSRGATTPLIVTETSVRESGSGKLEALEVVKARAEPNSEISDPGETASGRKLAAFVTAAMAGASAGSSP